MIINHPQKNRPKKGFTLVELLISMAIFVIFLGIVSSSYTTIVRAQKQANDVRKIYADFRTFLDQFQSEIRSSTIDYDCYEGTIDFVGGVLNTCDPDVNNSIHNGETYYLSLIKNDGLEKTLFYYDFDNKLNPDVKKVYMKKWLKSGLNWIPAPGFADYREVFSGAFTIERMSFLIFPIKNPYSSDAKIYQNNATQFQPSVTLLMRAHSDKKLNLTEGFNLDFQTTFSLRSYSRNL